MKRFVVPLAVASAMAVIGQVAVSQDASGTNPEEAKYVLVPMPKGLVRAQANEVDKEWSPRVVHLKGNARVRIYTATKNPHGAIVMQADEVDLNQSTGEISPRGNVRITVEDIK
jgi:lipopolysaccharide assembly outer membrane protein LptD (OstA)